MRCLHVTHSGPNRDCALEDCDMYRIEAAKVPVKHLDVSELRLDRCRTSSR